MLFRLGVFHLKRTVKQKLVILQTGSFYFGAVATKLVDRIGLVFLHDGFNFKFRVQRHFSNRIIR